METPVGEITLHWVDHGVGAALVALHGAGTDHREMEAALEAVIPGTGYRRIYPDLPGMGRSTADGLTGNDDVVAVLADFIEQLDEGPVLLVGHSYGGYLARGLAATRPDLVAGLALICPATEKTGMVPDHTVVVEDPTAFDELAPEHRDGFAEYFVVRTPAMARRYRDAVVPAIALCSDADLERIFANWTVDVGSTAFTKPTLIVAGRRDSSVGYADAVDLLERYPRATLAVLDDAGHALMHERPDVLASLVGDWLECTSAAATSSVSPRTMSSTSSEEPR
ncbi:MAG: alpha/beta hydrolase [Mycetocola sp.]